MLEPEKPEIPGQMSIYDVLDEEEPVVHDIGWFSLPGAW